MIPLYYIEIKGRLEVNPKKVNKIEGLNMTFVRFGRKRDGGIGGLV